MLKFFRLPSLLSLFEARLGDKDREILRLVEENRELRDRLYIKHQLPISGAPVTTAKAGAVEGWTHPRKRLAQYINEQHPVAVTLSDEDMRALREASQ